MNINNYAYLVVHYTAGEDQLQDQVQDVLREVPATD